MDFCRFFAEFFAEFLRKGGDGKCGCGLNFSFTIHPDGEEIRMPGQWQHGGGTRTMGCSGTGNRMPGTTIFSGEFALMM